LNDEGDEKTLLRKANESKRVVGREPESTEGGTMYIETRRKIRLGDSKTAPSPTLNTRLRSSRRNQNRLQVQSSASEV